MFFEDEKDIIGNEADIQISDDGTVTWEDVLVDNSDDDLLSINEAQEQSNQNVDYHDQFDQDVSSDDDEQLADILNDNAQQAPKQKAFDAFGQNNPAPSQDEDEFDINSQINMQQTNDNDFDTEDEEIPMPRKQSSQNAQHSSGSSPILILLLLIVIVVGGIYYFMTNYMGKSGVANQDLSPQSVQEDLNNTTAEDIAQRQDEDITDENATNDGDIALDDSQQTDENAQEEEQQDAQQEAEKKKIVSVIPTGRPNPFLPIEKYLTKTISDPEQPEDINYVRAGIPKPPSEYGVEDYSTTRMMTIAVSGIMYDSVKPSAIITLDGNDYFVQRGDKLDNYRVVDIQKNRVLIALGKNIYTANIGEEFNLNLIAGKAGNIPSKQGGGRQYYTTSYEAANILKTKTADGEDIKSTDGRRYVSESEIQINSK